MCVEVRCDDGETFPAWEAETQGELSRRLGGELVKAATHAACELNDDDCLCPIDIEATAKKYGYEVQCDGMDCVFIKPSNRVS